MYVYLRLAGATSVGAHSKRRAPLTEKALFCLMKAWASRTKSSPIRGEQIWSTMIERGLQDWMCVIFHREGLFFSIVLCLGSLLAVIALPYRYSLVQRF